MGLDLFHVKLIVPPAVVPAADSQDFFYLDELEGSALLAESIAPLVTNLVEATDYFTIYVFQEDKYRNYYTSRFGNNQAHNAYLVGSLETLAGEISRIETYFQLNTESKSVFQSQLKDHTDLGGPYIYSTEITYPIAFSKRQVIYHQEVGYQRKGMNREFYIDFVNCQLYFNKEDVSNAAKYLDISYRSEVAEHFKSCFIDNFVEGESVFFPSW